MRRKEKRTVEELLTSPTGERAYEAEVLFARVRDHLTELMQEKGLRQQDLARKLDLSEGRISQMLCGAENLTLKSLASIGWALGARFDLIAEGVGDHEALKVIQAQPDRPPVRVMDVPIWPDVDLTRLRGSAASSQARVSQPA